MAGYAEPELRAAAAAAVRAPSMHNSQPWRLRLRGGLIEVLTDGERRLDVADQTGWAARIACGAAVFNARLALAAAGTPAEVRVRPDPADPALAARLSPAAPRPASVTEERLHAAIPRRYSNRQPFWSTPVPPKARTALVEAARAEGTWLELVVGAMALNVVAEVARGADAVLRRDPGYRAELSDWMRTGPADDGVPVTAGGPAPEQQDLLPQRSFATHIRAPGRDFEAEPLIAVLGSAGDSAGDQVNAGQALQRVLLTAVDEGLATSMISQPIEVPGAREQLRLALRRFGSPQMVLRIGYGQPGRPTPRREIDDVIVA